MDTKTPPNGLPVYRLLSGVDNSEFCARVSEILHLGYALHGSPSITVSNGSTYVCQAVIWPSFINKSDNS